MFDVLVWIASGLLFFVLMELWARFAHGRLWHGPLYSVHHSHHAPTGWFEKNDIFSVFHASVAIAAILYGCVGEPSVWREIAYGGGLGATAFGLSYFVVHDGLVHGRLPVGFLRKWRYFRKVEGAHRVHHVSDGPPYGLFLGPQELRAQARRKRQAS